MGAGQYLKRRFFRLYPLHIFILAVFLAVECAKRVTGVAEAFAPDRSIASLPINVFLLNGLGTLDRYTWNVPSWSISTELVAYLVFGLVSLVFAFRAGALVAVLAGSLAGYIFLAIVKGGIGVGFDFGLVRCLAGFFTGVCAFHMSRSVPNFPPKIVEALAWVSGAGTIVALLFVKGSSEVLIVPLFTFLIIALSKDQGVLAGVLKKRPIAYLGEVSYSIYMVHFLIISLIAAALKAFVHPPAVKDVHGLIWLQVNPYLGDALLILMLVLLLVLSGLTYRFIERPWRQIGKRSSVKHQPEAT